MSVEKKQEITVATLNTYGVPFFSPNLTERYKTFSEALERMEIDIINLQEVHTYRLLKLLKERLRSFPHVAYERSFFGAKGGLATFSKIPLEEVELVSFRHPKIRPERMFPLSRDIRIKGSLISKLKDKPLVIINTHLSANKDGNWSSGNRFYPTLEAEIEQLAQLIHASSEKGNGVVIAGDFNISKESELYTKFVHTSNALDAFGDDVRPTFRSEFLSDGQRAHCIDYIFYYATPGRIDARQTSLLFQGKTVMANGKEGFISDHIGLLAKLGVNYPVEG
jgi:endonuclease/exonuclease/phosphatase family metal-dependent hydrolase